MSYFISIISMFQRRETEHSRGSYKPSQSEGETQDRQTPVHHVTLREAEVERDKKVSEAKRLLERASTYKEEAKREHEKVRPGGLMGSYSETCSR